MVWVHLPFQWKFLRVACTLYQFAIYEGLFQLKRERNKAKIFLVSTLLGSHNDLQKERSEVNYCLQGNLHVSHRSFQETAKEVLALLK